MKSNNEIVAFGVDGWMREVKNRPFNNVHRRTLDATWRQVIRFAGGNPDELVGPSHDVLLVENPKVGHGSECLSLGVLMILAERERQIIAEGWTAEHDAEHVNGELTEAATGYAFAASTQIRGGCGWDYEPENWPWHSESWKPSEDAVRNLVKAGALNAAEIDRILRLEPAPSHYHNEETERLVGEDGSDDDFIKAHGQLMEEMSAESGAVNEQTEERHGS